MALITRTPRKLIRGALLAGQCLDQNEDIDNEQANDALDILNELLNLWTANGWIHYIVAQENFSLTSGTSIYSIGDGATWDTDRPHDIISGFLREGTTDYPLDIMTRDDYNKTWNKSSGARPTRLYYQPTYPDGTVWLDYAPANNNITAYLDLQKPFAAITSLDSPISLPSEYYFAIRYNLAALYAPEYGRTAPDDVKRAASAGIDTLRKLNAEHATAFLDIALQPKSGHHMRTIDG